MGTRFDILVIGKGLVGSAAARHLTLGSRSVAVIGPNEPQPGEDPLVQAAHYDQARVQRSVGWEQVWTDLNMESVRSYAELERSTGIKFHHTPGCLYVNPYGGDAYLEQAIPKVRSGLIVGREYNKANEIGNDFPFFKFPERSVGLFESAPAGYIDPRSLVRAQCVAAEKQGCTIINATVVGLERESSGFVTITQDGSSFMADKVLVATGSFANHLGILKEPVALRSKGETVLLTRVSERLARDWSSMPSLLYECNEADIEGVYLLPPVLYPNGGIYLKIGANFPEDPVFTDLEEVRDWFRSGNSDRFAPRLRSMLSEIVPRLPLGETMTKRCIVSYTPVRRPYIGRTHEEGLYLAGGCNGYSAMCSDAMGQVAATLMAEGRYPEGYSEDKLGLIY
jgi:glycine/D-amino acid oxidase-like deaminating enzyme